MDQRIKDQIHYLILKTHSLTGLIPVGAFLTIHLAINSLRTVGVWPYQLSIDVINNLPFLIWIETGGIILPLLFHSLVGFYIYFTGCTNVFRYRYPKNWMYTLQRLSGAVVFVFLCYHLYTTVFPKLLYGKTHFMAAPFLIDIMNNEFKTWGGRLIYTVGILAATFHFANGLWGFCMSWGIIVGRRAQRNAGYVFVLFGLALTVLGLATVVEFSLHPEAVEATISG
ncbi:MAG: succinate dehydrogenase [Nitrospinae bacterium]|nr:succinate dehydrogenase [Nitrospinota bacterium]